MTEAPIPIQAPRRRWLKAGCGCAGVALLLLVACGIFLPRLVGGLVASKLTDEFGAQYQGSLRVPSPRLAWSSRQRIEGLELFAPDGQRVLGASLECPSILDLAGAVKAVEGGGPIQLGKFRLELEGAVSVDEAGVSSLAAALVARARVVEQVEVPSGEPGREAQLEQQLDLVQRIEFELELVARELRWTDPRIDVEGHTAALHEVRGGFVIGEGAAHLDLTGEQQCETRGPFSARVALSSFEIVEGALQPREIDASFSTSELSATFVDRLAHSNGDVAALLGDRFAAEVRASGELAGELAWQAQLHSPASRVALAGTVSERRLSLGPQAPVLELDPIALAQRVREWSAQSLPPGSSLEFPAQGLALSLNELSLELETAPSSLESLRMRADLELGAFSVIDRLGKGSAQRLELAASRLLLAIEPAAPLDARLSTSFASVPGSQLAVQLGLDVGWAAALEQERPQDVRGFVQLTTRELPIDLARKLVGVEERLEELIGGRLSADARAQLGGGELQAMQLEGATEQLSFALDAALRDGTLVLGEGGFVARARLMKLALADTLREHLPPGSVLSSHDPQLELNLRVDELQLALAQLESEAPLQGALLDMRLSTGALDYTDEKLAPRGAQLSLSSSETSLRLNAAGQLSLLFDARLKGEATDSIQLELKTLLEGELADARFDIVSDVHGFPTRVLDIYADQDGLLVDVLGPSVDADLRAQQLGLKGGPLELDAESKLGRFSWRGRVDQDEAGTLTLTSGEGGRLEAAVGLSPLFGERIVGPLVPLLVNVAKSDATPVGLSATDVLLPLDGNLRGFNAKLRLDLGQVTCSFLPAFAQELPGLGSKAVRNTLIEPIELQIVNGLVRYERLPIKIDGRPLDLAGSYDLVTKELDLTTDVRLSDLGGEAGRLLQSARKLLGDAYAVPIHIGGSTSKPRISLKQGFLEATLKKAGEQKLEDELSRGLRKLFGD